MSEVAADDHAIGGVSRYFDEVPGENAHVLTEVAGTLPAGLRGTFYTNGAGRWTVGSTVVPSLFDVDGMVGAFVLDGETVRFSNRFVRTATYRRSLQAGEMVDRGVAHQRPGGAWRNVGRLPANTANTSVLLLDDTLLALNEVGRPYRLDADTLITTGECDLGGVLKGPAGAFSAHPTYDPLRGVTVNFGLDPYYPRLDPTRVRRAETARQRHHRIKELLAEAIPSVRLRIYETDAARGARYLRSVRLPVRGRLPVVHDMALTERYAVFTVSPYQVDTWAMMSGLRSMWDAMHLVDGIPSYFVLVPRDGGKARIVETDPFFSWHYTNAFDDGPDVVVELSRWSTDTLPGMKRFGEDSRLGFGAILSGLTGKQKREAARITRFRIRRNGVVVEEAGTELTADFPQFDHRRGTQRHHVTFVVIHGQSADEGTGIGRIDEHAGTVQVYQPPDNALSEPIFVPRAPDSPEGQGWILTVGYHEQAHRSRLMIFDAERIDEGPLSEAWLSFHLPMRYHGAFTPRVARLRRR